MRPTSCEGRALPAACQAVTHPTLPHEPVCRAGSQRGHAGARASGDKQSCFPWSPGESCPCRLPRLWEGGKVKPHPFTELPVPPHSLEEPMVAQMVKSLPAVRETWVRPLCWADPLEKEMATHSSILAWKIPWREEPGGLQSMGSQRVGHN